MANLIGKNTVIVDLDKPLVRKNIGLAMASGDKLANRYGVQLFRNGAEADASSCTVTGYLIMPNDETLRINGTASGNLVYVDIPESGYQYDGAFTLTIKIAGNGMTKAVAIFDGKIAKTASETIVDDDRILYGVEEILALIDRMEQAETDATTAAGKANTATTKANTATSNANTATTNANTATSRANTAAAMIEGMTVSTSDVGAGTPASAEISDANGVKNIHFNLRQGITGATPNITFQVETGEPGTQVEIEQTGTAENPVIKLTIPRGDTGAVDGVDYFAGNPSALGEASPGTANGVARGDHVHPMPDALDVGAVKISLAWTNAASTSEFAIQDVAVDVGENDHVLIMFRATTTAGAISATVFAKRGQTARAFGAYYASIARRDFTVGASGISFKDAEYFAEYSQTNNSLTVSNRILIPMRIYVVKGVQ